MTTKRIALLSDLHGYLPPDMPEVDLLICAGDVCPVSDHRIARQRQWLLGEFNDWIGDQDIIGTFGNHDFALEEDPDFRHLIKGKWLIDEGTEWEGLKIWGSPYTPTFYNWAFMEDEYELNARWLQIPEDTDILITHGPAYGIGDLTLEGINAGSGTLREHVRRVNPKLHVFGHIHEGYGYHGGGMYNVSLNTRYYHPTNPIVVVEVEV